MTKNVTMQRLQIYQPILLHYCHWIISAIFIAMIMHMVMVICNGDLYKDPIILTLTLL